MNEPADTNFTDKGASYEVARDMFSLDIPASAEQYPVSPHAPPIYSMDKLMTPLLSDRSEISAPAEQPAAQAAPDSAPRKQQSKRSWVFTHGYGKRVYENDIMLIQCLVPGCGRFFKANRGSTSSISYHLLAAHEIPEYPGKIRRTMRKKVQARKADARTHPDRYDLKCLEFSSLGARAKGTEFKDETSTQGMALKEFVPLPVLQDQNLLHMLQLSGLEGERATLMPTDNHSSQFITNGLAECRSQMRELLSKQDSLSLSITRCSGFVPVTVHFLDDWAAKEAVICMLDSKDATGAEMANQLVEVLDTFQITAKVFTITTDFSPSMLVLVDELHRISSRRTDFKFAPHQHIPCIGHVVNEVVNNVLQTDLEGASAKLTHRGSAEAPPGSILAKLTGVRQGILTIKACPLKLSHYQSYFNQHQLRYQELVVDVPGDWESTFTMLENITANHLPFNSVCTSCDMMDYMLAQEEIAFLEEAKNFLGLFQAFSTRVSSTRYPIISKVLMLYDKMLLYLDTMAPQKPPYIQKAFLLARKTLNSYFGKGLDNYIYPIAIAMDPRLKFAFWKPPIYAYEDCEFLKSMVRQYWESHFSHSKSRSELSLLPQTGFDDVFGVDAALVSDELSRYLQESPISSGFINETDIWEFWKRLSQSFPHLSKMASKFLAIPASSQPCERRLVHSKSLMPMSSDTHVFTQQFSLLRSWRALLQCCPKPTAIFTPSA